MQKVDDYIAKKEKWMEELNTLRRLLNDSELKEEYKWSSPVYTINGKNVVGIAAFKNYTALWFFQGVFLKDKHQLLINAQEEKTKALRQMRFDSVETIDEKIIKSYILEAIQNQKDGKEVKVERTKKVKTPMELLAAFKQTDGLEEAFKTLTPGRQKDYAEYITSAKRESTKLSRLEKIIPMIIGGVGLYDKYKNC